MKVVACRWMALIPELFQIHLWNWRIAKRFGTSCSRYGSGNGWLRTETIEFFSKFRKKYGILTPLKPPLKHRLTNPINVIFQATCSTRSHCYCTFVNWTPMCRYQRPFCFFVHFSVKQIVTNRVKVSRAGKFIFLCWAEAEGIYERRNWFLYLEGVRATCFHCVVSLMSD